MCALFAVFKLCNYQRSVDKKPTWSLPGWPSWQGGRDNFRVCIYLFHHNGFILNMFFKTLRWHTTCNDIGVLTIQHFRCFFSLPITKLSFMRDGRVWLDSWIERRPTCTQKPWFSKKGPFEIERVLRLLESCRGTCWDSQTMRLKQVGGQAKQTRTWKNMS